MLLSSIVLSFVLGGADADFLLHKGDVAPPFSMRDLEKKPVGLATFVGAGAPSPKKAVVLVFFATWCEPCKKEVPVMKALHERWSQRGVQWLYVGLSQGEADLAPFAKAEALPWPVVPDGFGLLARRYGASALPHAFVVDAEGKIAFQHRGIAAELEALFDAELASVTGAPLPTHGAPSTKVSNRFGKTLTLARAPSGKGSTARWQPLAALLSEAASAEVVLTPEAAYAEFEAALRAGRYDIANAGPLLCHDVREKYEPLVRLERQGAATYQGILFTKRDKKLQTVAELRGKVVGMVSKSSASGGLYPLLLLRESGLLPDKDVTVRWLGTHEQVAAAVRSGEVDAGACFEDCRSAAWPDERERGQATRILGYTAPIPGEMIIVNKSMDKKTREALRKALLGINGNVGLFAQISEGEQLVTSFVSASSADLASIGKAAEAAR